MGLLTEIEDKIEAIDILSEQPIKECAVGILSKILEAVDGAGLEPKEIEEAENEVFHLYGDMLEYPESLSPKDHPANPLSDTDYEDGKIQWVLDAQLQAIKKLFEGEK